ncbi:DUF294 nucleotidyltransferase-like domain-containing protein [Patulibacter sp. SYSU D01012]|uniref:DUF294 nucleotidyltransferase-like domain-containing protein n=1 Tax=Patulibacter sp. SYSU D01012 TaxID=2817381 RepID=UPI001B3075FD
MTISSPRDSLQELERRANIELAHIAKARLKTYDALPACMEALGAVHMPADSALLLMGSWGRAELLDNSDADWLLVLGDERAPEEDLQSSVDAISRGFRDHGLDPPGSQGVFGTWARGQDVLRRIGLDADSNTNLTRRILILLESVALTNREARNELRAQLLKRYLGVTARDFGVPRFLLNDLVRYWRTICVDFAGKENESGLGWGLRNAKLRNSRKMLFASGLLPALLCHQLAAQDQYLFLSDQLSAVSVDRIAYAFLTADAIDAGARCLAAYDQFLGLIDDGNARAELKSLQRAHVGRSEAFAEARALGKEIQASLTALLFETETFGRVTREYGIF